MNKAIFLDRDGVINKESGSGNYVLSVEQMKTEYPILPRVEMGIRLFNDNNYKVLVATNQRAVAKGLLSIDEVGKIHAYISHELEEYGAHIDGFYVCPHEENSCECRKPKPGLLLKAAKEHDVNFNQSWMIGNHEKDILTGKAVNCKTILIGSIISPEGLDADYIATDLYEAAIFITEGEYPVVKRI